MGANTIKPSLNTTLDQRRIASPAIWADCPWEDILDPRSAIDGIAFFDDFLDFPLPGTQTSEAWLGRYKVYNTGSGKWITDAMPHSATASTTGGVVSTLCDTDGDAAALGTQASPFLLTTTMTNSKLWFEARIATTSILTNMGQLFCGLAENQIATFGAATPLANADATASTLAMIGFNRLEDGLGVLNTSYADHAATWTDIGAAANSTLAANTWIKLGIKVNMADTLRCVRFYVDNVECANAMTKAALLATTYLDVSGLGPCLAFFADSAGTADYVYIDWWRGAQIY